MNVAIIGSGSWATALAKIIMHNTMDISWHIRRQEVIDEFIEIRRNPNHLEWAYFDVSRIHFSADINTVIEESDLIILAIPSPYLKQSLNDIRVDMSQKMLISAVKGMIPKTTLGAKALKRLRVYAGAEHENQAQKPELWTKEIR